MLNMGGQPAAGPLFWVLSRHPGKPIETRGHRCRRTEKARLKRQRQKTAKGSAVWRASAARPKGL
jgi:hypothetical protein